MVKQRCCDSNNNNNNESARATQASVGGVGEEAAREELAVSVQERWWPRARAVEGSGAGERGEEREGGGDVVEVRGRGGV